MARSEAVAERISASKVAKRLDRYMSDHELDYRDLAAKLDVPLSQAHSWATGTHDPNLKSLKHISRRLRIDLAELV